MLSNLFSLFENRSIHRFYGIFNIECRNPAGLCLPYGLFSKRMGEVERGGLSGP